MHDTLEQQFAQQQFPNGYELVNGVEMHAEIVPAARFAQVRGELGGTKVAFDADRLGEEVLLRSPRQGDRFQPLGMAGHKKLQDFMVDAKIPRSWRDRVPLVVSPRGIAWVVGWRIAEWAKVKQTEPQLELRFIRE